MSTFTQAASEVVTDFWTVRDSIEKQKSTIKAQLDGGIVGPVYAEERCRALDSALRDEYDTAYYRLNELESRFSAAVDNWATPDGAKLTDPDIALLDGRFPLQLTQFQALARKHAGDFTFTQVLRGYAEKKAAAGGANWIPYVSTVTQGTDCRRAAFKTLLDRARADIKAADKQHAVAFIPGKLGTPGAWDRMTEEAHAVMGELDGMLQP